MSRTRSLLWLALLGLAAVTLFWRLGGIGLVGPDEPRYAEIAAEMFGTHDYVTPRLMGQPWFEKPVLDYWLAAGSYHLLGVTDAAARLPSALLGFMLCLGLTVFLYRQRGERAAMIGALLCFSSAFLIGFARAAAMDMPLTAPLALAQLSLFVWLQRHAENRKSAPWLAAVVVLLALATLAKGPVALVLAGGTLLAYAFWARQPRWALASLQPWAVGLYLAVAAPWFVLVAHRNPGYLRIFFLQHNVERFTTGVFHHAQPFWFYIPILLAALFPWTAMAVLPFLDWRRGGWTANGPAPHLKRYLWCSVLVPLVFFSLSRSKLPGYLLPAVPALIALIALAADDLWERMPRWPLVLNAALAAGLLLAFPVWLDVRWAKALVPGGHVSVTLGFAGMHVAIFAVLVWLLWRGSRPILLGAAAAGMAVAVLWATGPYAVQLDTLVSARPLARALAAQPIPGTPTFPKTTTPGTEQSDGEVPPAFAQQCPLWGWRLQRETRYGAEFYLHRVLPELDGAATAAWPQHGWVVVNARESDQFPAAARDAGRIATPTAPTPAAPWRIFQLNQ